MLITSTTNDKIKYINKLKLKKNRDIENKFIIETLNLIKEAYLEDLLLEVYVKDGFNLPFDLNVPIYTITENVMDKIKSINTCEVLGIVKKRDNHEYIGKKFLLLDGVQDPGNLGTILRSSVSFGVDTVILSSDSCDMYNDKVIRASEGAIFKVNVLRCNILDAISDLQKLDIPIYGTDVKDGVNITSIEKDKFAIIMGSEGNGISKKVSDLNLTNVYIKIKDMESLNVAVSASIILYELSK